MTQLISQPQDSQESQKELPQPKRKPKHRLLLLIGLLAAGAGLTGLGYFLLLPKTAASLEVSGRVEGYETNIGAKVPGRIGFVAVREGDTVRKGQVIVRLDDEEIQAQLKEAQARVDAAKQQEQQARLQMDVLTSRIQEASLSWQQSQGDAQGRISQAQSNVAAAEAQLNQAQAQLIQTEAELKLAKTDRARFAELVQGGAIAKQRFDQAQTQVESLTAAVLARRSMVEAAQRQVSANQGQLVQVQTTSFNPGMRQAQIDALQKQLAQARFQQKAAESEIARATAAQQQIAAKIKDLNVVSPIDGTVTARTVEPGEVVAAGKSLLSVINPNTVYLRGYIPEGDIGKVRVGQSAKVYLDSFPNQPLSARVSAIDTQASFTPENTYFKKDRVKQVFGAKLSIDNPAGFAKPGMPADAEIMLSQDKR